MAIIAINKENFEKEVLGAEKPVLLDLWAPWCIPCKQVGKTVEELATERDDVIFGKLDIEECPEIAAQLGVINIPVLVLYNEGKVVKKMAGVQSKKTIIKKLLP